MTTASHPLVETRSIGALRVHAIQAGTQLLDGGAMFGIVPKPLWERRIPPDERNRIPLGLRCLVIEHPSGVIVIDAGIGNKESGKFKDIYGVANQSAEGNRTLLEDGLAHIGMRAEDVSMLINTHLHFDHAGGNTYFDESGALRITFPNAKYVVQAREYADAVHPNERTSATYLFPNFVPIKEAGKLELIHGEKEIAKGITLKPTPGHTPGHQSILIQSDDDTALYLGDLVPTFAHLPLPWVMGYDLEPLVTLETKRRVLKQAMDEDWTIIFEHDVDHAWAKVGIEGKSYGLRE